MENNAFNYQYSASRAKEAQSIRQKYMPKEESPIERLRALDGRVQAAGVIPSLCIGIIGCLIFGIGMCLGLDVLPGADWLTVVFAVAGILVMLPAYPVYRHISASVRRELVPEILKLADEIEKETK